MVKHSLWCELALERSVTGSYIMLAHHELELQKLERFSTMAQHSIQRSLEQLTYPRVC